MISIINNLVNVYIKLNKDPEAKSLITELRDFL